MATIHGLPAHPLLVHFLVVLMPLACGAVVLHAVWPTARARLGIVTPLLAGVCMVLVPIVQSSGRAFRTMLNAQQNPLVLEHQRLANELLPWAIALFGVAAAQWASWRFTDGVIATRWARVGLAVLSIAVAVGTAVLLYRIGDAGAKATWSGVMPH
jgi:hypothetical protein